MEIMEILCYALVYSGDAVTILKICNFFQQVLFYYKKVQLPNGFIFQFLVPNGMVGMYPNKLRMNIC